MGNYSDNYGYFYLFFVLLETTCNHRVVFSHYFKRNVSKTTRVFYVLSFSCACCFLNMILKAPSNEIRAFLRSSYLVFGLFHVKNPLISDKNKSIFNEDVYFILQAKHILRRHFLYVKKTKANKVLISVDGTFTKKVFI